jgi:hypothetical protein
MKDGGRRADARHSRLEPAAAIGGRPHKTVARAYRAESLGLVCFTPDNIPAPTSTIANTKIQCAGTCIKCAP